MQNRIGSELKNYSLIAAGIASAGMGIKGFLLSSNFIDGGVTGASMLLSKITDLPLALWLPLVNLPFIIFGIRHIGWAFAIRSVIAISGLALTIVFVNFPDVTKDLVLTAVFGGMFLGAGIGLAVRGGAVLDGTEIVALVISKRTSIVRVSDVILLFNSILFIVAMTLLGVNEALYSILTYIAAAKTLDFILYGLDQYTAITIVSDSSAAITQRISQELGRGVTVFKGYGGRSGLEKNILYCVVTRIEIGKVKDIVRDIDPAAFLTLNSLDEAEGSVVRNDVARSI